MVGWPAQGFGCSPPTQTCCSQSFPQSESQVVGCKVAVCGDMLWVIEALTRRGWGAESSSGDYRLVWCLEEAHGFHWEMTAERFQDCLDKKTFIIMYGLTCLIKRRKNMEPWSRSQHSWRRGKGHGGTLILVHAA